MALQGHKASIKVQSSGVTMTDEATTGTANLTYQITDTAKRIIDMNTSVVVEDGGSTTSENYTIDYLNGTIVFSTATARVITVTGKYMTPVTVATANSFTVTVSNEALENTPFEASHRTYQGGLVTGTANLGRYHVSDDLIIDEILASNYLIIELNVSASEKISFYGLIATDSVDATVEALITETIDVQITNQIGV